VKGYWNNLRPFEKRVLVGVLSLVFIVLNVWFVFPHFSDLSLVQRRNLKARKTLEAFQKEIAELPAYQTNIAKLMGESGGRSVESEDQVYQFDRAILDQAQKTGVNITGKPTKPRFDTNTFFLEVSESINVVSAEKPLVDFLYNLGSADSLIRVRDLTLKPADNVKRQELSAIINLVASYQKNPPKAAAPVTPAAKKAPTAAVRTAPPPQKTAPGTPTNKTSSLPGAPAVKPATSNAKKQ
jgi:hypothetical protein